MSWFITSPAPMSADFTSVLPMSTDFTSPLMMSCEPTVFAAYAVPLRATNSAT